MNRSLLALLLSACVVLLAPQARADLLPADEMPIPRLAQLRGAEQFRDFVIVIQNCYPQRSSEDATVLPYCVILEDKPFITGGRVYLAPKELLTLKPRTVAQPPDAAAKPARAKKVEGLRAHPVFIAKPEVNLVDPDGFFKDSRLKETDVDFGIRDHIAVKIRSRLSHVIEVHDVKLGEKDELQLETVRVDWVCLSGKRIAGPRPAGPNKLPPPPNCEPKAAPVPSASAAPPQSSGGEDPGGDEEETPIWTFLLVGAVLVAIVLVVVKKS